VDSGEPIAEVVRSADQPDAPVLTAVVPFSGLADNAHLVIDDWEGEGRELVVVDDGAPADSLNRIRKALERVPQWTLVRLAGNHGAGIARNAGLSVAGGEFTVFLDCDDRLDMTQLDTATQLLSKTTADLAFCTYDQISAQSPGVTMGMWKKDQQLWLEVFGDSERLAVTARPQSFRNLLRFTNYPWNKIARTSFLRNIPQPLFGSTPIHNDILGHWKSLIHADEIVMVNTAFTTHIRQPVGTSLTTRSDATRVSASVGALDELATVIHDTLPGDRAVDHEFWTFVKDISANTMKYLSTAADKEAFISGRSDLVVRHLRPDTVFYLDDKDPDLLEWLVKQ